MGIDTDKIKTKVPKDIKGPATGKKVYDKDGNLIDTIDDPISQKELFKISPGEKLYDSKGNVIREANAKGGMINKYAKGGEVKGYMDGGEVEVAMDNSPSSGMITQRGWGASRKT